jgi:hypothetical protein
VAHPSSMQFIVGNDGHGKRSPKRLSRHEKRPQRSCRCTAWSTRIPPDWSAPKYTGDISIMLVQGVADPRDRIFSRTAPDAPGIVYGKRGKSGRRKRSTFEGRTHSLYTRSSRRRTDGTPCLIGTGTGTPNPIGCLLNSTRKR